MIDKLRITESNKHKPNTISTKKYIINCKNNGTISASKCKCLGEICLTVCGNGCNLYEIKVWGVKVMKKAILISVCMLFLLSAGVNAADRDYYKLKKGTAVYFNVLQMNRVVELATGDESNVAIEYFNDLLRQKSATQTEQDLIVYKFDKFSTEFVDCYRVKLKNGGIVKFINTYTGYYNSITFKDGDILGWVVGTDLKKIKHK